MKLKSHPLGKEGKCPCCDSHFIFVEGELHVNCESDGQIEIPGFWVPFRVCSNPLCKWSRVKREMVENGYV